MDRHSRSLRRKHLEQPVVNPAVEVALVAAIDKTSGSQFSARREAEAERQRQVVILTFPKPSHQAAFFQSPLSRQAMSTAARKFKPISKLEMPAAR
jgi:hypothetical protein